MALLVQFSISILSQVARLCQTHQTSMTGKTDASSLGSPREVVALNAQINSSISSSKLGCFIHYAKQEGRSMASSSFSHPLCYPPGQTVLDPSELLDWQVTCQFFGQPWSSWSTGCTYKLFPSPGEMFRAGIFLGSFSVLSKCVDLWCLSAEATISVLPQADTQSSKTSKTETSPQKTWGAGCMNQILTSPWSS